MSHLTSILANTALVLVSILLFYLVAEVAMFRVVLPTAPLSIRTYFPDTAGTLLQNSKKSYVPGDYTAILGDSHAEGLGDWLLASQGNRAAPFHSGDVVHALTGHDVVSFGKGGAGSAEGMVLLPARALDGGRCYVFPEVPPPSRLVVYFYEGNDFQNNVELLQKRLGGRADPAAIDAFLQRDYGTVGFWRCHIQFGYALQKMLKFAIKYREGGEDQLDTAPMGGNSFIVAGQPTPAPGLLQGAGLELSESEMDQAALVFERSLAWLRKRFPDTPVVVAQLPSPLTVYVSARPTVSTQTFLERDAEQPAEGALAASARICERVRAATARQGAGFLDLRPVLRNAAKDGFIHGPRDWKHFNETGHRVLGAAVAARLDNPGAVDSCSAGPR